MNDCVFGGFLDLCDGPCECCGRYISANSEQGDRLVMLWDRAVEDELRPLKGLWKEMLLDGRLHQLSGIPTQTEGA